MTSTIVAQFGRHASYTLFKRHSELRRAAFSLEGMALSLGSTAHTITLFAEAHQLRAAVGVPPPAEDAAAIERALGAAKSSLGDQAFAAAWRAGA